MPQEIKMQSMGNKVTVKLPKGKDCKGSVRFETDNDGSPITNIYVGREWAEISEAKLVSVTVEIIGT